MTAPTIKTNTSTVKWEGNTTGLSDSADVTIQAPVVLTIDKTASPTSVISGSPFEEVKFTIVVKNTGATTANAVIVTDTVPVGFTISGVTTTGTFTIVGQLVTVNIGTLAGGALTTIVITTNYVL